MGNRVAFYLNGKQITVETRPGQTLLGLLREDLQVLSLKNSCGVGECGVCTVLLDGMAVRSCLLLADMVDGKRVETVESLGTQPGLHPLQQAFLDCGAVQCGYCTSGMLLTAKALLDKNLCPSREEIRAALSGNLCRCTGYKKILDAVELAAARMRGEC